MARGKSLFELDNPEALTSLFDGMDADTVESALRQGAAAGATVLNNEVSLRAPVRYGYLRSSASVVFVPEESAKGVVATYQTVFVGVAPDQKSGKKGMRNRDVARWLEYGTSKMPARAFVRPAFDARKEQAADACADKILEVLTNGGQASKS